MGKGSVNWDDAATWEKVVAAMIASNTTGGGKIDYRGVALHFGCTYDTIENRLRKTKKLALELKAEVERGERDETCGGRKAASAPATPRKPKTPKKDALANVTQGRVAKTTTPKSSKKSNVKQEMIDEDNVSATMSTFDQTFAGNNFSHEANYNFDYDTSMDQGFEGLL